MGRMLSPVWIQHCLFVCKQREKVVGVGEKESVIQHLDHNFVLSNLKDSVGATLYFHLFVNYSDLHFFCLWTVGYIVRSCELNPRSGDLLW